ncbi:MAG TPA: pyridoxal phosphate-dependent aminotransferase, partial [Bacteroidia bacterium]|nr:pyridoxal phosphate-dependent aminotransferase [Bacteroidia bacterium]
RRTMSPEEVLHSTAMTGLVKRLFNWYFREDLYGAFRSTTNLILSGGSLDPVLYGLPECLKSCVEQAMRRDWYGYSDSRGREATREAVARLENAKLGTSRYDARSIAITLGGTSAVSSVADMVLGGGRSRSSPAICAIPNYPPLVYTVGRRSPVRLVPLPCFAGRTSLAPLFNAIGPETPLVLLQTVTNPTGTRVDEDELGRLLDVISPTTVVILDECHECVGVGAKMTQARMRSNVVRISSLSKIAAAPGLKVGWLAAEPKFVDEYYEYASTSYGGPPSLFYLLLEVMARMEAWRLRGVQEIGAEHVAEFESHYDFSVSNLRDDYRMYLDKRERDDAQLIRLRQLASSRLNLIKHGVVDCRYSINVALNSGDTDAYSSFRHLLRAGVSVFPGDLMFCLEGGWLRVTTAVAPRVLNSGIGLMESLLGQTQ